MKKIKLFTVLLSISLMSFKSGLKIGTGIFVADALTNETKAQTPMYLSDSTLFRGSWYSPVLTNTIIAGTNYFIFDGKTALPYEAPVYTWNMVQDKPTWGSVAYSSQYTDLIGIPTIPTFAYGLYNSNNQFSVDTTIIMSSAKANSAISAMTSNISTKISVVTTTMVTGALGYTPMSNTVTIPTNNNQLSNGSGYLTAEVDGSITNEIELPSQTSQSGKYLTTNGSTTSWTTAPSQTTPTIIGTNGLTVTPSSFSYTITQKRQETYSGTTNASGVYTVSFSTAYSVTPNIQANIIGGTDYQILRITSVSTTGFTVLVRLMTSVLALGVLPTYQNVTGASVDVLITEK